MLLMKLSQRKEVARVIEYLVTGGAWFWSGYLMFAFCYSILKIDIVPAKVFSYVFGLTVNWLLQRYWVFSDTKTTAPQEAAMNRRYIYLAVLNLVIDTAIVWFLAEVGITPYIGQFVSAGFFTVWNYVWYKWWVFARGGQPGHRHQAAPVLHRHKHVRRQAVN